MVTRATTKKTMQCDILENTKYKLGWIPKVCLSNPQECKKSETEEQEPEAAKRKQIIQQHT